MGKQVPSLKKGRKRGACAIAVCAVIVLCVFGCGNGLKESEKEKDLNRFINDEYTAVHLSMWDMNELSEEWYETYYNDSIKYAEYRVRTPQDINDYLEAIFKSGNVISKVYLGLDPILLKQYYEGTSIKNILEYRNYVEKRLTKWIVKNPDTEFHILFPTKALAYWDGLSDGEYESTWKEWELFTAFLGEYKNVKISFAGSDEWLIANYLNFEDGERLKDDISKGIYLNLFSNDRYLMDESAISMIKEAVDRIVAEDGAGRYEFKDLSGSNIVFFGDSTIAYPGKITASIPSVVEYFTNARCYNEAIGGTTASHIKANSFVDVANAFVSNKVIPYGEKPIFIVQYGLNDYFEGVSADNSERRYDYTSFAGGLRSGIRMLRKYYPKATFILATPYELGIAEGGHIPYQEGGMVLDDVRKVIREVASEENAVLMDLYYESGITAENCSEYLTDGVHPNYQTDFIIGMSYAKLLSNIE